MHFVPWVSKEAVSNFLHRFRAVALKRRTLLAIIAWSVAFVLLARVGKRAWEGLQVQSLDFSLVPFALSVFLLLVAFLNGGLGWHLLLRTMGVRNPLGREMAAWLIAQAAKYLPAGTLWYFGGRFLQGKHAGLDGATVSLALVLEFIFYLAGALLLFGLSLGLWPDVAWGWQVSMATLGVMCLYWLLAPSVLGLACRCLRHQRGWSGQIGHTLARVQGKRLRWLLLFYLLQWILIGTAFWFLVASIHPVGPRQILTLAGSFSLASALGYLVFVIPGGWGVREEALAFLLGGIIPSTLGPVVSILARLWYIIVEGICVLLGLLIHRVCARQPDGKGGESADSSCFTQKGY